MKKRNDNNSFLSNENFSDLIEQIRKSKMYLIRNYTECAERAQVGG